MLDVLIALIVFLIPTIRIKKQDIYYEEESEPRKRFRDSF